MKRVLLIRSWLLLVAAPTVGIVLTPYLAITHQLAPWHLPLLVGLIFGPFIAVDNIREFGALLRKVGDTLDPEEPES